MISDETYKKVSIEIVPMDTFNLQAKLTITPKPDYIMRVFVKFKFEDNNASLRNPSETSFTACDLGLEKPFTKRSGFSVLEWGGVLIDKLS